MCSIAPSYPSTTSDCATSGWGLGQSCSWNGTNDRSVGPKAFTWETNQGWELNADREAGVGDVGRPGRSGKTQGTFSNRASEEVEWGREEARTMGWGW